MLQSTSRFFRFLTLTTIALTLAPLSFAQGRGDQTPQITRDENGHWTDRFGSIYRPRYVSPVDFGNSPRIDSLIRAGQLYLSLQDAIALSIENNLDIELERFGPKMAESDVLRARGGGLLRGVPLQIRELPQGTGGPGAPFLTTVGGAAPASTVPTNAADLAPITEQTSDLSILGTFPLSSGSVIPQFDPSMVGVLNWAHQTQLETAYSSYGAAALVTNGFTANAGYQQGFATGASISAGFNNLYTSYNAIRSDYNNFTNGSLGFTVTQPLLQGFGLALNRRYIRIGQNDERISDYVFEQQVIDTVANVIRLYWDYVSLVEDVRVKQQALSAAQKLYDDNKSQVEIGTLAPLELKRAQAEVARNRQDLTNSQSLLLQQELLLKNVLTRTGNVDPVLRAAHIIPLDKIQIPAQEPVRPVQDLLSQALETRPDVAQARIQIDNSNISLKGSKNELLPSLNLIGSLQNNGMSGQINSLATVPGSGFVPNPDPLLLGGFGNLLSQLFLRNFPNYAIGLQLNIPLRNRVAQADVVRDELQVRQTEVRLKQLLNQVRLEVENALVALQRSRESYDAAVETRQLQEEALDAEQQRYAVGASTSFFVIQYQRDVEIARSAEVIAAGNYAKSQAALDRAIGATLHVNHVEIQEALQGRISRPPTPLPVLDQK